MDTATVILPETILDSFTTPAQEILKPMFDLIWNACGFPGSANFDADGKLDFASAVVSFGQAAEAASVLRTLVTTHSGRRRSVPSRTI